MRASLLLGAPLALALVTSFAAAAPPVAPGAAPPSAPAKKQCIAAAENAQQLRAAGHLVDARRTLGQCTATSCPAVVRHDCGMWLDEIDAALPTVTVKPEDDAGEVMDARVLVDGEVLARGDGRAVALDPGAHRFTWAREGGNVEQEVVLREGERNRVIVLRAAPGSTSPRPARRDDGAVEGPPPPSGPSTATVALPFVVGGAGIAFGLVGGVLWGIGLNDRANMVTGCARTHGCTEDEVDASRAKLVAGDVLMGIGVVAVATAVVLYFTQDHGKPGTAPESVKAARRFRPAFTF